ncbi:hypothetical protein ACQV2T_06750 [Facklamia sp. P13069]|uniref:hypothetical protein n=1 Tax=Facklamia sp. P13069 TaxID=3421954 RepID=UPI003D16634A
MSVVVSGLKTFKVNLLGKEYKLKINNKVWVNVQSIYGMSQKDFQQEGYENNILQSIKFIMCVLEANGIDEITEEMLINEADSVDVELFMLSYNKMVNEKASEALDHFNKEKEEEGK